jgi:hypothetical protein
MIRTLADLPKLGVLAGVVLAACGSREPQVDVAAALRTVPPFTDIPSLMIPVRVRELASTRPRADSTDFGLTERVGSAEVWYVGQRSSNYDVPVERSAKVRHIEVSWQPSTDDSAAHLFSDLFSEIARRLDGTPACFETAHPVYLAQWPFESGILYLKRRFEDSVQNNRVWVRRAPTVTLGIALDSAVVRPLLASARGTRCR